MDSRNGDQSKRRLGMLPEVLPSPTNGPVQGSPRQRTKRTMERLLAATATGALIASCSNGGYGVVDPLPPPSFCKGVAHLIQATAVWKERSDGSGLVVEVTLSKPTGGDVQFANNEYFQAGPVITIVSRGVTADVVVLELEFNPGEKVGNVYIGIACSTGTDQLTVSLDITATIDNPTAGAPVKVLVFDEE